MDLCDLTHEQKLALVALTEAVSIADGTVSEGENKSIDLVATSLGDDAYRQLLNEAESRFGSVDALKAFLPTVTGKGERELIYGTILNEVISDPSIESGPSDLLHWLAATWGIETAPPAANATDGS